MNLFYNLYRYKSLASNTQRENLSGEVEKGI